MVKSDKKFLEALLDCLLVLLDLIVGLQHIDLLKLAILKFAKCNVWIIKLTELIFDCLEAFLNLLLPLLHRKGDTQIFHTFCTVQRSFQKL